MSKKTVTSTGYCIDWHVNMIANRLDEAIGQWGLQFADGETDIDALRALRQMLGRIVEPAMRDAYKHEHNIQGYHFHEKG